MNQVTIELYCPICGREIDFISNAVSRTLIAESRRNNTKNGNLPREVRVSNWVSITNIPKSNTHSSLSISSEL